MTKFILHGGYERRDNDLNRSFYRELAKDIPEGGTLLLVYFASESTDVEADFATQTASITAQAPGKTLSYALATEEGFLEQIEKADGVHFRGGNTNKLLSMLCTYPDLSPLIAGKTVSGSSAGVYALARFGASHSEKMVREGLGFVPVRVVCHYESPDLPPTAESLATLEHMAPDLELVLLRDHEHRVFQRPQG